VKRKSPGKDRIVTRVRRRSSRKRSDRDAREAKKLPKGSDRGRVMRRRCWKIRS
jgi:hypothetical protein